MKNEVHRVPPDFFRVSGCADHFSDQTSDDDHATRSVGIDCRSGPETRMIIHQMIAALSAALKKAAKRN